VPSGDLKKVAIFNASQNLVEMLKGLLVEHGYYGLDGRAEDVKSGVFDFIDFLETHKPEAIIWDIAPPYDQNWTFCKLLRSVRQLENCPVVLTTTHKQHLDSLAGQDTDAIEIVGKPYDLRSIVVAVTRAIDRRDNSASRHPEHDRG
jgi:DNA-binding response OmpR family regulator